MNKIFVISAAALSMTVSACSMSVDSRMLQTKFAFPNCDFAPIGKISTSDSVTTFLSPPVMTESLYNRMVNSAKAKAAAQYPSEGQPYGLVDLVLSEEITNYVLPIYTTRFSLDATVIRKSMCGEQQMERRKL